MRKATKTTISLAVVLIAGLNLIVPAFAQDPFSAIAVGGLTGASGAGLFGSMASMSGIDIGWSGATSDPMDAMWNVLNPDHVYFSGEKHEATNIGEDVYDYIQVDIGDWLDAQSDFIINFAQTHNVQDDDSGTVTSPVSWRCVPNQTRIDFTGPVAGGSVEFPVNIRVTSDTSYTYILVDDVQRTRLSRFTIGGRYYAFYNLSADSNIYFEIYGADSGTRISRINLDVTERVPATNINWSSGDVNTSVFDGWESAKVKIPKSISQLQPGWTPVDFFNELDRIWSGAGEDNIIIEDGGDTPVPPVPVPSTPLGDVPFDDWVDLWGQGIWQQLENQSDALDFIGSNGTDAIEELESIDENIGALEEAAESIDTNIGIGNGLLGGIKSLAESAVDYLEGIAEYVGELVEEIVEGTETLIAGILNQIPQVFSVIFGPIKQASSIWHYVVEWIQSIGAPFQFIWSMASGTSYYIILPVYASLAAAVVLAFYKRFGK